MENTAAKEISPAEGLEKVRSGAMLLDVRTPAEFNAGHVEGAINISHDELERRIAELGTDKSREMVFYCRAGKRALHAEAVAKKHGFMNTYAAGGYDDWKKISE